MPILLPGKYNPQMLADEGYIETERLLFNLTAELESVYGIAYEEMLEKAEKYLAWFAVEDNKKRKLYENGGITKDEYIRWRRTAILTGRNNYQMVDVLATDLTNVNLIAASIINGYTPIAYATNTNYQQYVIEKSLKAHTSFTLFDEQTVEKLIRDKPDLLPKSVVNIPRDKQWNKTKLNSAILQGILQGETVDKVAARLAAVTDMNYNSAVRNATTMTTSAQNAGRNDSIIRAEQMGVKIQKRWLATLDGHTRPSHRQTDGEVRDINKPFSNGLQYPGDPHGAPAEVYNCRCCLVSLVDEQQVELSDRFTKELGRWDTSYTEWKNQHGGGYTMTWAAKNVNRDLDMFEEYKTLLGHKIPSNFKDFQKMKYTNRSKWWQTVSEARKARNRRRANI